MKTTNISFKQLCLWGPKSQSGTYTNATGADIPLTLGTLIGRIVATNKVTAQASTSTDGSQVPIGILMQDAVCKANSDTTIYFFVKGDMNSSLLIFGASDTLATNITVGGDTQGTIGDILTGKGMIPIDAVTGTYTPA